MTPHLHLINHNIEQLLFWLGIISSAIGIVWLGGCWICVIQQLSRPVAFLIIFACVGISSLLGLGLMMLPNNAHLMIALFMPTLAFVMWVQASSTGKSTGMETLTYTRLSNLSYRSHKLTKAFRLLAGIALFGLTIGIARGYPHGMPIPLGMSGSVLHQLGVFFICILLIVFITPHIERLRIASLWRFEITIVLAALFLLALGVEQIYGIAAGILGLANTLSLAILMYSAYIIAQSTQLKPHLVLGIIWLVHLFFREVGRLVVYGIAAPSQVAHLMLMLAILVLIGATYLLFGSSQITQAWSIVELNHQAHHPYTYSDGLHDVQNQSQSDMQGWNAQSVSVDYERNAQNNLYQSAKLSGFAQDEANLSKQNSAVLAQESWEHKLADAHGLTLREVEVMQLIAAGRSKPYISRELHLSENTIKTYSKTLYQKLGIHNRQELIDLRDCLSSR